MIEIKNAKITSTMLGVEDHGILTCWLYLEYGESGCQGCQGFGGYSLDTPDKTHVFWLRRVGCAWGMEFINRILAVVGVEKWEQLPGKHIRVRAEHSKVHAIGNIIKDNWFCPETDLNEFKP